LVVVALPIQPALQPRLHGAEETFGPDDCDVVAIDELLRVRSTGKLA
jgi:hypothetical protein